MKQAKKDKEHKLPMIQARELVYRFRNYKDNMRTFILTKGMTKEERETAFYTAIIT